VLIDYIKQAFVRTICTVKNLAFSVKDKFLQVQRHRFRDAKILCVLRNGSLHFFAYPEKVINSIAACKNYCRKGSYVYLLLAKILRLYAFNNYEGEEINV
jgi:hypothetical protein